MRKRVFNWQGQRFVYLGIEGEPGGSPERQARALFERAGAELATLGLALEHNVVRTRVFGRTRADRDIASTARGAAFVGAARAATSRSTSSPKVMRCVGVCARGRRQRRSLRT